MRIQREKYLDDLVVRMDNGAIKVITDIRRCGKTTWCSRSSANTCGSRAFLTIM